jgi:hypothetical protein
MDITYTIVRACSVPVAAFVPTQQARRLASPRFASPRKDSLSKGTGERAKQGRPWEVRAMVLGRYRANHGGQQRSPDRHDPYRSPGEIDD